MLFHSWKGYAMTQNESFAKVLLVAIAAGLLLAVGCTSRWAMKDPDYQEKYGGEYDSRGKVPRMVKQAIDARHVEGKSGVAFSAGGGGVGDQPLGVMAQLGGMQYATSSVEIHGGLVGLLSADFDDTTQEGSGYWLGGLDLGARLQTPTRLAPFVGGGGFVGVSDLSPFSDLDDNGFDDDNDGFIDEGDEEADDFRAYAGVYPEIGVHYWVTADKRISGFARYYRTTEGEDNSFYLFGMEFVGLNLGDVARSGAPPPPITSNFVSAKDTNSESQPSPKTTPPRERMSWLCDETDSGKVK
jgi:hypothetical protein